ncbi:DUF167 family protein [Magnetospirillum sp. UT-4]|uniref:DUF167 domain-containing protein n=1 Tax=Magnetospirillum sp. UT-4 TaxID=2681467 RepID=UPI00137C8E11|nr:DUF167 family protein [Magnetospirillum sp. UT-4]CAA7619233.1 conserved hypothetical protein [Magnetospirillum sp. UT-4]
MTASPVAAAAGGVRVRVRLTPKAARDRIDGLAADADGAVALKVSVTAVPEDGKANAALIKLLAKEWKVAKSALTLVQGATDRRKVIHVAGDPDELGGRLATWMERLT